MKRKRIKLRYKKERVVFSDVLPYELPITFTNRFFYRFLVKNEVEYIIEPLDHYNPQNEMLPFHKTKCSETQNEASSL